MKTRHIIMLAVVAAALAAAAGSRAAGPTYIVLTPNLEKCFQPDGAKNLDLRLRTFNGATYNGWVVQTREILRGEEIVLRREMLFSAGTDGDILYHGDLDKAVFDTPITWVDAPLQVGKSWISSTMTEDKPDTPSALVHYVFAVLEEEQVTCPMGTYPCHRVYVATILPDGTSQGCNFWYNPACGIIRCSDELTGTFALYKAQIIGVDPPDVDPEDPPTESDALGLLTVPNPFNPRAELRFDLAVGGAVTVEIYDVAGRLVRRLLTAAERAAGPQAVAWDGRDEAGRLAASGTYVARIRTGEAVASGTMMLVR